MQNVNVFQGSDVLRAEICTVRMQANVFRRHLQSLLPSTTIGESRAVAEIIGLLERIEKTADGSVNCPNSEIDNYYHAIRVFQESIKVKLDSFDNPELTGFLC